MAKHITRWSPDTCDCVIEYEWDDEQSQDEREHTFKTITQCNDHDHDDDTTSYEMVVHENMKKNQAVAVVADVVPDTKPDDVVWNYDDNRQLSVEHPVQDADTTPLQTALDNHFGTNEVEVV